MIPLNFHLPLNAIDQRNQPPKSYLLTQDFLLLTAGALWTLAYILYIQQSIHDTSYGMPLLSLFLNLSWELTYTLIYPPNVPELMAFMPWVVADEVLAYLTVVYGRREWEAWWGGVIVSEYMAVVVVVGVGVGVWGQCMFARAWGRRGRGRACFWAGYTCQVVLSWESVGMVVGRGSVRGGSMGIWWCRFLGTLCVTALCQWKYWHYPADYAWIGSPLATFLFVATELGDLIYPFVFKHVLRVETGAPSPPHDPILYLSEILVCLRAQVWSCIDSHPSEVAGVVFVAVTWGIFTAVLWCVDNTSGSEGLRKSGNLKKVQKNREVPVGTWAERDKDTDRRNKGPRQKTSKARSKAADYRDQIIKSMTEQATVQ